MSDVKHVKVNKAEREVPKHINTVIDQWVIWHAVQVFS